LVLAVIVRYCHLIDNIFFKRYYYALFGVFFFQSLLRYTRRVLWCLDHGYEYVQVDLMEYGRSIGHSDREKEGFARIVEAVGNGTDLVMLWHCIGVKQLPLALLVL
jgi:hypothetical protein